MSSVAKDVATNHQHAVDQMQMAFIRPAEARLGVE